MVGTEKSKTSVVLDILLTVTSTFSLNTAWTCLQALMLWLVTAMDETVTSSLNAVSRLVCCAQDM